MLRTHRMQRLCPHLQGHSTSPVPFPGWFELGGTRLVHLEPEGSRDPAETPEPGN